LITFQQHERPDDWKMENDRTTKPGRVCRRTSIAYDTRTAFKLQTSASTRSPVNTSVLQKSQPRHLESTADLGLRNANNEEDSNEDVALLPGHAFDNGDDDATVTLHRCAPDSSLQVPYGIPGMTVIWIPAILATRPSNVSSMCQCGDPLHLRYVLISPFHQSLIVPWGPQSLWNVPAAEVGLSSLKEPASGLVLLPLFPSLPLFSFFLMSDAEEHDLDVIHQRLNQAISLNLYTGLAYGTPPIPIACPLLVLFHACLIIHLARHLGTFLAVYLISMRILLCVRVLSISDWPLPARTFKLSLLTPSRSSKGSVFRSLEHMFLFGITTITFIFCTTVIVLGPGLASQSIPSMIKTKDPSFDKAWSPHKIHLVEVIIAFITRLVARFSLLPSSGPLLWNNERLVLI
jgi:hypothetical protein